ncbi:hypothetical protein P9139_13780 [Curtobacterium flaccumfaciens]|nr:hypothetical protein P9139_13780 [Curtobacterium flaccumfaciens]
MTNDLRLDDGERLLIVTGPNQGGKTTTARIVGQLHHLAAIGAPVPATNVRIMLTDQILTQFERGEQLESLEGKLGEEVHALHDLLDAATDRTLIVLNEIFTSTAAIDAELLSREILRRAVDIAPIVVCVTFIDSLTRFDERTVSMVSLIDPADPTRRTFKVERRAADGRAYAQALADKYHLTDFAIAAAVAENTDTADPMLVGSDRDGDA